MQVTNLKAFVANIGITMKDFAEIIECHPAYLCRVNNGKCMPGRRLAQAIKEATEGSVVLAAKPYKRKDKNKDQQQHANTCSV